MNKKVPEGWRVIEGGKDSLRESISVAVEALKRRLPRNWSDLVSTDLSESHAPFMRTQDPREMLVYLQKTQALEMPAFTQAVIQEIEARLAIGNLDPRD